MSNRVAILSGVKAAMELHTELGMKELIESRLRSNVDVFGSIVNQGVSLVFRPLEGLLGACIDGHGVIISTNRPLSVQRFTGAHEFGHIAMRHMISVDGEEILTGEIAQGGDPKEIEANAFAAEFLLPRWLLAFHAKQQGWRRENMMDPLCVYQLSLRVGASYEATVRSLERYKIIDIECRLGLLNVQPKSIKQQLLPGYSPQHWYRDVWLITEKDEGAVLEGQPEDLFLFRLNEKAGAGFLWDFATLKQKGFVILSDQRAQAVDDRMGADVTRLLAAHSPKEPRGRLHLALRRPWQAAAIPADQLKLQYDLLGKEVGLPRALRPELAAA